MKLQLLSLLDWPEYKLAEVHYNVDAGNTGFGVVLPNGALLNVSHHADYRVNARVADFIVKAINERIRCVKELQKGIANIVIDGAREAPSQDSSK